MCDEVRQALIVQFDVDIVKQFDLVSKTVCCSNWIRLDCRKCFAVGYQTSTGQSDPPHQRRSEHCGEGCQNYNIKTFGCRLS
jgi:hypothetical protein